MLRPQRLIKLTFLALRLTKCARRKTAKAIVFFGALLEKPRPAVLSRVSSASGIKADEVHAEAHAKDIYIFPCTTVELAQLYSVPKSFSRF